MKTVIAIVAALAACANKSEDKKAPPPAPRPQPSDREPPAELNRKPEPGTMPAMPIKNFVELDTEEIGFKPKLVIDHRPQDMAARLSQFVRQDKTSAAVKQQTDELMKDLDKDVRAAGVDPDKNRSDIEFALPPTPASTSDSTHVILYNRDDGTVRSYGVWFRTTPAEAQEIVKTFDELWGPHKMIKDVLGERTTWFAPNEGFRASTKLDPSKPGEVDVTYVRYLPLASFFGDPGPTFGFEKPQVLIGATVEQLQAAYGKALKVDDKAGTATLTLPPTDYAGDTAVTTILMFLAGGKVRQWNVSIPFEPYEPARAEYEAALDAKLGKQKPKKIAIKYSKYTHELEIEVSK